MDVTSLLSVPVWIMEPFTILQKAAEIMEYTDLLDKANACSDEYERCVPAVWGVWMAGCAIVGCISCARVCCRCCRQCVQQGMLWQFTSGWGTGLCGCTSFPLCLLWSAPGVPRTSAGLRNSCPPSLVGLVTTHAAPTLHTHSTDTHTHPVVTTGSIPARSFAWVAAYCVSPFGAAERAWKPFNPILGETFELEIGNGVHYLAEQVR